MTLIGKTDKLRINETERNRLRETYTTKDVISAGCNLEPLKCVHCGHVGEVTFMQYIGDSQCGMCGEWQNNDK